MQKQQFNSGTPVTPEWLNAIQNPSFEGTSEDVGHLPLPPNYNEKQQCKTIHVSGESTSVYLGNWPYNAVIIVHRRMNGETPVYPRNLSIHCSNTTGAIIVIPELDRNGILNISMVGSGSTEYATATAKNGDIIVMNAFDNVDLVETRIRKIQSGDRVEFIHVQSSIFTVNGDASYSLQAYFDSDGNLIVAAPTGKTALSIDFETLLKAPSFCSGIQSSNEHGFLKFSTNGANASFEANSAGNSKSISYSTSNNIVSLSESATNQNNQTLKKTYLGTGSLRFETHTAVNGDSSYSRDLILIGKDVDASLNLVEAPANITILRIPSDTAVQLYGANPQKSVLSFSSFSTWELRNGNWILLNG